MNRRYLTGFLQKFYSGQFQERSVSLFCRSMYGFLACKIILTLSFTTILVETHHYGMPHTLVGAYLFFLQPWIISHYVWFAWISIGVIVMAMILPRNYFMAFLVFWLGLNIYRIHIPVINGSDHVLNIALFLIIFLSDSPAFTNPVIRSIQLLSRNFAWLFFQIQIGFIYLLSGTDKLMNSFWRSGQAIQAIQQLEFYFNPHIALMNSPVLAFVIAWIVILFELLFCVFILFEKTRLYTLALGTIFHLLIWYVLSLPDFGVIMILSYSAFLRDTDYTRIHTGVNWITNTWKEMRAINKP